jgi:hypothetical protein
LAYPRVL